MNRIVAKGRWVARKIAAREVARRMAQGVARSMPLKRLFTRAAPTTFEPHVALPVANRRYAVNGTLTPRSRAVQYVLAALLMLLVIRSPAARAAEPASRERTFLRALEAFDIARTPDEYRASAAILESLLTDGFQNGAVYYNMGNAYMRAGDYGRAIAAYRHARPYRPRDQYLDANLRQALSVAPGHLPEPPPPWWTHVLFWSGWLSFPEKAYAAFAGFFAAALMATFALFVRQPRVYWLSAACAVVGVVLSIDAGLAYSALHWSHRAVVTSEAVARKGIGKDYEPAFDQPLKDGAEFTILSENGDWIFGHFEGIGDGWLRREQIAL